MLVFSYLSPAAPEHNRSQRIKIPSLSCRDVKCLVIIMEYNSNKTENLGNYICTAGVVKSVKLMLFTCCISRGRGYDGMCISISSLSAVLPRYLFNGKEEMIILLNFTDREH